MGMQRRLALTGVIAATAMLLAGCGGFGNGSSSTGNDSANGGDSGQGTGQSQAAAPAAPKIHWTLMTASTKKLGKIMVNGKGLTVYRFDNDLARPRSLSKCAGTCAKQWPPVIITSTNLVLKGFDATLLGRIKRADGRWQLTLNGWPLYTFYKDKKPGQWLGQGLKGKWYVASIIGTKAIPKKAAASGGSEGSSGAGSGGSSGGSSSGGSGGGDGGYGTGGGGY
ncbi:MAG TPA: hypothetical protein VH912_29990 [Streptosporangiaceae bacterium]